MNAKNVIIAGTVFFIALSMWLFMSLLKPKEPFERAMLSFRFDDAYASQREAIALLDKNGIKVSVYCITDFVGTPGYMSWDEIQALAKRGHEIGSHSATHNPRAILLPARIEEELRISKQMLLEKNIISTSFAWPYGLSISGREKIIRKYYDNAIDYPWIHRFHLNGNSQEKYALMSSAPKSADEFIAYLNIAIRKKCG